MGHCERECEAPIHLAIKAAVERQLNDSGWQKRKRPFSAPRLSGAKDNIRLGTNAEPDIERSSHEAK
jgi:hypothetical protein